MSLVTDLAVALDNGTSDPRFVAKHLAPDILELVSTHIEGRTFQALDPRLSLAIERCLDANGHPNAARAVRLERAAAQLAIDFPRSGYPTVQP